jgi:TctA family transporter
MSILDNLALGFSVAFSLHNLAYCFIGALLGTIIGVLPGIGPLVTISVLLPLTFGMPADGAIIMLAGIYYGASYGGSTTAILVRLPGEASSAVTCIDGYEMARQGRAGPALAIAALGSLAAGCIGTLVIALVAPMLVILALKFGAPEYSSLMLIAIVGSAAVAEGSLIKGLCMALLGILVSLVGTDVQSGIQRFTFGIPSTFDGIDVGVIAIGLFAFAEILKNLSEPDVSNLKSAPVNGLMPTRADLAASWKPILRASGLGTLLGVLPGVGLTMATFASYFVEKRLSKHPDRFGRGAIEGVAGPEAANNAAAQASFIPTLALGVPGSASMALLLAALTIQGVTPGPRIITDHPTLFWGLVASMWIGNLMLVVLNLPLVGLWVTLLKVPYRLLFPAILVFSCIGIYGVENNYVDVLLATVFGLFGYIFIKIGCGAAPFILGCVVGQIFEENFRRALLISRGDPIIFIDHPISLSFLLVTALTVILITFSAMRRIKDA